MCDIFQHENCRALAAKTKESLLTFAHLSGIHVEGADEITRAAHAADLEKHNKALCDAAAQNRTNAAKAALDAGASPNCRDTPEKGGASPLWFAAINGNLEMVILLVERGAEINDKSEGDTALHGGASGGHIEICRWLLEHGADKTILNDSNETAAESASMSGWPECSAFITNWI